MKRSGHLAIEGRESIGEMFRGHLPNEMRNAARAATYAIALEVADELKVRIARRTGAAEKSIFAVRRRSPDDAPVSDVRGGADAPYLLMIETGTMRTKAQPYIVPTVEGMRPLLPMIYREQVGKKLEAAARRARKAAK